MKARTSASLAAAQVFASCYTAGKSRPLGTDDQVITRRSIVAREVYCGRALALRAPEAVTAAAKSV